MQRILSIFSFLLSLMYSHPAFAAVHVSQNISFFLPEISAQIAPGQIFKEALVPADPNGSFTVNIFVMNKVFPDIIALVCDEENFSLYLRGAPYRCHGGRKQQGHFSISGSTYSNSDHYIVFDNRYSLMTAKSVIAKPYVQTKISQEEKHTLEQGLEKVSQSLLDFFKVPEFDIYIRPCGERNAFSSNRDGDITMCSEILYEAILKKKRGIFLGIFFHELGHTLLNLWGLPGWDNEKTVDEFATVMLVILQHHTGNDGLVNEWLDFFDENADVVAQAQAIAQVKSTHPLDIQRITAIRAIMRDPLSVTKRWNKVLYENMQDASLRGIAQGIDPIFGQDIELAKSILSDRQD